MNVENTSFLEYDKRNIRGFQQMALEFLFNNVNMSKVVFCGGIADYINLREYYDITINDIDIIFENEQDLQPMISKLPTRRYPSKFYKTKNGEALVNIFRVGETSINIDSFPRDFSNATHIQSPLLGKMVWHTSFEESKINHNNEIHLNTSQAKGNDYEWKRLYKHSRKASLYNNVTFLEEKNLIHTIKKNIL
ncbi:hypothetical protein C8C83_4975 [Flavobacterium sp. 90]|uniref:hypothetical protein n=1 Tax=unclassified Flavobacterium TaxID=196869 RepID=UPI000EAC1F97|nr:MULTISPECIES: hypothetical protein [unclassified Flavobacterium]RKR05624.1 hypothetical protein C8C82_5319 [Flavobacterium sp. 81]TCK56937.1 hypothetical protein C8C83_4975 [Flavobacterium sp. 90]